MQVAYFEISCECIESQFLPKDVNIVSADYRPGARTIAVTCAGKGLTEIQPSGVPSFTMEEVAARVNAALRVRDG